MFKIRFVDDDEMWEPWKYWLLTALNAAGAAFNFYVGTPVLGWVGIVGCLIGLFIAGASSAYWEARGPETFKDIEKRLGVVGDHFDAINAFMRRESKRAADVDALVKRLREEHVSLEPIVSTQREAVDAILTAHSRRQVHSAWKERAIGFGLGTLASLFASAVWGLAHR